MLPDGPPLQFHAVWASLPFSVFPIPCTSSYEGQASQWQTQAWPLQFPWCHRVSSTWPFPLLHMMPAYHLRDRLCLFLVRPAWPWEGFPPRPWPQSYDSWPPEGFGPCHQLLPWEHILSQPLGHPAELFFLLDCTNGDFSLKLVSDRLIRWRAPCPLLLIYQCTELFYLCITASLFNDSLTWTSVMHGSLSFWPVRQFACNIAISMEDFKNKVKPYLFTRINQQILFSFNSVFLWILLLHTLQRQTWGLWVRSQDAATADVSELYYGEGHTTKSEGGENRTEK